MITVSNWGPSFVKNFYPGIQFLVKTVLLCITVRLVEDFWKFVTVYICGIFPKIRGVGVGSWCLEFTSALSQRWLIQNSNELEKAVVKKLEMFNF
jgi:hypothetical protein